MLYFSGNFKHLCLEAVSKCPQMLELIRKRHFRVKDTSLSYRQINSLEKDKIINNTRGSYSKWRSFNLVELVYLKIVSELREYGVRNDQLKMLKSCFFKEKVDTERKYKEIVYCGELAVLSSLAGVRTDMLLLNNGEISMVDSAWFLIFYSYIKKLGKSFIYMSMNEILREVLIEANKDEVFKEYQNIFDAISELSENKVSFKEQQLLDIVRNDSYSQIQIKKGKDNYLVYGSSNEEGKNIDDTELFRIISEKRFGNITIHKRDGKIVNFNIKDIQKI